MADREQTAALLELYFDLEEKIIADMARRIAAYDYFIPAAQHQLKAMEAAGACREDIYRQLSELCGKSAGELAAMLKEAVDDELVIDENIYRANGLNPDTAMNSEAIAEQMKAGWRQTNGSLRNITGTTANLGGNQLRRSLDNAWLMVESGAFSTDEAVRQAVDELAESGLEAVRYKSGRMLSLEAAVGMCVRTGVNQTAAKSREVLAGELGCDLVEVTAHGGARPEHAAWQGSICSLSGKSRKYPDLREYTGYGTVDGLCGANCRHTFHPWFEGTARAWTEGELAALDEPKYEYEGKKLTEYEAQQVQRGIERNIRKYKRKVAGFSAAGQDSTAAAAKVREWQKRQRDFLAATGLKRQSAREQVALTGGIMPLKNAAGDVIIVVEKVSITAKPNSITQKTNAKGGIDRNYYGDDGRQVKQISNNDHGHKAERDFGNHGEHAHDYYWDENGNVERKDARELTEQEREDNSDFL